MDKNYKTYSRESNKKIRLAREQEEAKRRERDKFDDLMFLKRLDSDDEQVEQVDEIVSSPIPRTKFYPVIPPRKQYSIFDKIGSSSASKSNSPKKAIEISDDDGDNDISLADPNSSSNNIKPKYSQSPRTSSISYSTDSYAIDEKSRRTLDYGEMLNDTIVHFYMNYLMKKEPEAKTERIHLFNSFFFSKFRFLWKQQRGGKAISTSSIKQIVARWDKDIKIFEKDFLVIPVCEHKHWFLLVVAFAYNVPADGDEPLVLEETATNGSTPYKEPAILIFDSLGYKYMSRLTAPLREIFLKHRWVIERPKEEPRNFGDRTLLREISAKVPRQRNSFDCGVHLLRSFEKFLATPKRVYKKVMDSEELSDFYFDMMHKRHHIKSLIPRNST